MSILIRRILLFMAVVFLMGQWQSGLRNHAPETAAGYSLRNVTGAYVTSFRKFFYFFYYTGYFPVMTTDPQPLYQKEAALNYLEPGRGALLRTEDNHAFRAGNLGAIFLFLPDALRRGSPENVSPVLFNQILFCGALVLVLVVFAGCGMGVAGSLLVVAAGSDPFLLYENYARNNVFGQLASVSLILLALHLPLMVSRASRFWFWAAPVISAVLIAFFRQVRPEHIVLVFAVLGVYVSIGHLSWRRRAAPLIVFLLIYFLNLRAWEKFWDFKYHQAVEKVEAAGGTVYRGERMMYHSLWHPVWGGLGDFDPKYGYEWKDDAAYRYALPAIEAKFGKKYSLAEGTNYLDTYYEGTPWRMKPECLPEYGGVMRDKVLGDMLRDPLWYAGILFKRAVRILHQTTPLRFAMERDFVTLPFSGWLLIPLTVWLVRRKDWPKLKILCFLLTMSFPALFIYSGGGMPYYSLYHLAVFALGAACVSEAWTRRGQHVRLSGNKAA